MKIRNIWRGALVALGLVLALSACSSGDSNTETSTAETPTASPTTTSTAETDTTVSAAAETTTVPAAPQPVTASTTHETRSDDFPDILAAQATPDGDGTWRFDVTVSSPYDTADRYADAWRVVGLDGTEYGVRVLTHDHANEQPFTRSQSGIAIPAEVTEVLVEGRDLANGWGGGTLPVNLTGSP